MFSIILFYEGKMSYSAAHAPHTHTQETLEGASPRGQNMNFLAKVKRSVWGDADFILKTLGSSFSLVQFREVCPWVMVRMDSFREQEEEVAYLSALFTNYESNSCDRKVKMDHSSHHQPQRDVRAQGTCRVLDQPHLALQSKLHIRIEKNRPFHSSFPAWADSPWRGEDEEWRRQKYSASLSCHVPAECLGENQVAFHGDLLEILD